MLSFSPGTKLEIEMKLLQGLFVESHKSLEGISSDEAGYLNRFAFISNIGASTRIESAVLTDLAFVCCHGICLPVSGYPPIREWEWKAWPGSFYSMPAAFRRRVPFKYHAIFGH